MIRAIAYGPDGRPRIVLGLTAENLQRLQADQPIRVNLAHLDPAQATDLPDIDVVIFHATESAVAQLLSRYGGATSGTS